MNEIFERLKEKGYKGFQEQVLKLLLCACSETDTYLDSAQDVRDFNIQIIEDEYFTMLIKAMNKNL